ncbi:uncharacterized protein PAC_17499 [Phialocephala subalpina]|uniref:Uncharacterized protein n=1 Tax=Phialocephala subalpina TaxID=576137 RepID=A0A1L7XRD8_9HELO|nr:uncharacterized protein PAC_17499 [Phialocephala subalpina]
MDPVSIVGLVGTCLAIGGKIVSISTGLQQIVGTFKAADKDIARVSNQLKLFNSAIELLRVWLDRNRSLASELRETLKTAFEHCEVIVSDIEEQVQAVLPEPGQSTSSFRRKINHLWNEQAVQKYEGMITNQLVAFNTIIQALQLNGTTELDKLKRLQTKSTKKLFAKSAEDAKSITESKSTASQIGDHTSDNGENLSVEFSIDKEITTSKPYVRQYRRLLKAQIRNRGPQFDSISEDVKAEDSESNFEVSTTPSLATFPQPSHGPPTQPTSQGREHSSEVLHTWNLYREETREKVAKLCAAALEGDLNKARSLIESGAIIDAHDEDGDTPLLCAIEFHHFEVAHFLLDKGASVHLSSHIESREDSTDSKTLHEVFSPIHRAAEAGCVDIMDRLIESGACVNESTCELAIEYDEGDTRVAKNFTPLHLTAYDPECNAAALLIDHGANISAQDSDGSTALMMAVYESNVRAVQINLAAGAPIDLKDNNGLSPFELSCSYLADNSQESIEMFISFIKHGANIENFGHTWPPIFQLCLQYPLSEQHPKALSLLLEAGADIDARLQGVAHETGLQFITPIVCLMPGRRFWWSDVKERELAIRLEMLEMVLNAGARIGRWTGFDALSRLLYAFFNYCEDMRQGFPVVLGFATYLVKGGAKFSDGCPHQVKHKDFQEGSRRTKLKRRILCALHLVAEHRDKSYKRPGDFMAETQDEFVLWVAGGCHRREWPWPMIPFDTEHHFKSHRSGGLGELDQYLRGAGLAPEPRA